MPNSHITYDDTYNSSTNDSDISISHNTYDDVLNFSTLFLISIIHTSGDPPLSHYLNFLISLSLYTRSHKKKYVVYQTGLTDKKLLIKQIMFKWMTLYFVNL